MREKVITGLQPSKMLQKENFEDCPSGQVNA